ncbi:ThiF family adenylyltransferase [Neobacillus terrae]|uniref:ThiF family adenylyltransferase n=1 Tax=Neobacillus terrae TaxID=3034837 RepID=UPI00140A7317|nr:ThiF family adenylyltransferase [Neobacillus terrae]NHM33983.1 hypothetical protein [Neobacillus terrae]
MGKAFKKTLRPIIKKDDSIEIHFNGTATTLDDPGGTVFEMLELLDGSISPEEIALKLDIPLYEVEEAIESLNELGFMEDITPPSKYSPTELERYQANLNYFSGYASLGKSKFSIQDKLKNSKVVVLGLGGGSLTASYLAGLGVGEIVGVDCDTVERTNLNRQFLYNEDDIGRLKSEVAEEKITKINPEVSVKMYNREIRNYEDLLDIIEGADAVISMMDTPVLVSTRWVNAACMKLKIPFYRGGFSNQSIMWERIDPRNEEPCYDCKTLDSLSKDRDNVYRLKASYGKVFSRVNTGFAPNLSILTGLFASDVVNLLTGAAPLLKPCITVDTATMAMTQSGHEVSRHPFCPTCSGHFDEMADLDDLFRIAYERVDSRLNPLSTVDCSHLTIQENGDEFTVGDPYTGEFIQVPEVGVDVINLLDGKRTIELVKETVELKYKTDIDVLDFVITLLECELVYSIDGEVLNPEVKREPNKPLFKLGSFFYSRVALMFYGAALLATAVLFFTNHSLFPRFKDLFVYEAIGLSALNILIVGWGLTLVHEVGHLLATSKENISSKIRLNLRMIFLVAETDMTGLWAKPKKNRYVPFLAGMLWDAAIALVCLVVQLLSTNPLVISYSKLVEFLTVYAFLFQFVIFLRTDMYFVISNWKNTSALHQNSRMYLLKKYFKKNVPEWDELPEHEQKNAVWFGHLYGVGGTIAIILFLYFQVPPILYAVSLVYKHLTTYSIGNFYFWDSLIILAVFLFQGGVWFVGFRNSMKERRNASPAVAAAKE